MGRQPPQGATRTPGVSWRLCIMGSILLGALLAWVTPTLADPATGATKVNVAPEVKQSQMVDYFKRVSSRGVIPLTDQNYKFYAVEKPRPYHLMVLFTATASRYQCAKCGETEEEFTVAAESYFRKNPNVADSPLFFIRLDFDTSHETFKNYEFKGVPIIIHVPPAHLAGKSYVIQARDRFPMHAVVDAEGIAKFASDKAGVEIEIYKSPYGIIIFMLCCLAVLALFAKQIINLIPWFLVKIQNKYLWMLASLFCYTCSISGLIFDIIRSPPPFHMDQRSGQIMFFHPQSGQQFVVEGFIIGGFNIMCAVAAILLVELTSSNRILKNENHKKIAVSGCLGGFTFFFYQIFAHYRMKNRWYMRA